MQHAGVNVNTAHGLTIATCVSASANFVDHIEFVMRLGATSISLIAGTLAIITYVKNWRNKK